jgi:hypothetical protein
VPRGSADIVSAVETAKLFFQVQEFKAPGYEPPWLKF